MGKIFEEIMAPIFLTLMKIINPRSSMSPNGINKQTKINRPRYIIIILLTTHVKEKTLKSSHRKKNIMYRGRKIIKHRLFFRSFASLLTTSYDNRMVPLKCQKKRNSTKNYVPTKMFQK